MDWRSLASSLQLLDHSSRFPPFSPGTDSYQSVPKDPTSTMQPLIITFVGTACLRTCISAKFTNSASVGSSDDP